MLRALCIATFVLSAGAGIVTAVEPEAPKTEAPTPGDNPKPTPREDACVKECMVALRACLSRHTSQDKCEEDFKGCIAACDDHGS
jgi:hypothetical protein